MIFVLIFYHIILATPLNKMYIPGFIRAGQAASPHTNIHKIARRISPTDIGTEELAHLEMVSAMVHQLTQNLSMEEIEASGFAPYYVDHTVGVYPQSAGGIPFNAGAFQSKGDAITDLMEDMAAEQKARTTYDNILRLIKDSDVAEPIRFLRAREIVHFQRFGEALRIVQDKLNARNFYAFNPAFDRCKS